MLKFLKLNSKFFKNIHLLNCINKNNLSTNSLCHFFSTQEMNKKENITPSKIKEKELKPEPFIPFEKLTISKLIDKKKKNLKETYYYFGNEKAKLAEKKYNVMEFFSKKLRREYIRNGELDSHKHIIPVKRLRTKMETLDFLKKRNEMAAVIEGREEFPDINIVLDRRFVDKLQK